MDSFSVGASLAATLKGFGGTEVTLQPPADSEAPTIANTPDGAVTIASNAALTGDDARITAVLDDVTCTDNEDSDPVLTRETPATFPVNETTNVTFTCTDANDNASEAVVAFTITGFDDADDDGIADADDPDDDNDGTPDAEDAFPWTRARPSTPMMTASVTTPTPMTMVTACPTALTDFR